jgi:uncharacterized membrane protein HdeD (DUF308 family)
MPTSLALEHAHAAPRWSLVARGVVALVAGVMIIIMPAAGLVAIVAVVAALFAVDGVLAIGFSLWTMRAERRWWLGVVQGLVTLGIAAATLLWPEATILALTWATAAWAIWQGVTELALARAVPEGGGWLAVAGALSLVLGIIMIALPMVGLFSLLVLVSAYLIIRGASLLALSARAHSGARPATLS